MQKLKRYQMFFIMFVIAFCAIQAQDENELCLDCHSDRSLTGEVNGKEISMWVRTNSFNNSVHAENG